MDTQVLLILTSVALLWIASSGATETKILDMTGDVKLPQVRIGGHDEHHRVKRKVLHFENIPHVKWPLHIYYYFEDFHLLFPLSTPERNAVRDVLAHFMEKTCFTFEELAGEPTDNDTYYMRFTRHDHPGVCSTGLGVGQSALGRFGQEIRLGELCFTIGGHVMFTIAGALGMHGEVRRPDRDDYVDIFYTYMDPFDRVLMAAFADNISTSHDIHYDYGSVMHLSAKAYIKPELEDRLYQFTVVPKNKRYLRTMGQASEFAFHDALVMNTAYCERPTGVPDLDCQNGGYQAPPDYTHCACRDGWSGLTCEDIDSGSAACTPASGYRQVTDNVECVTSPNYDGADSEYDFGDRCTWILQAPRNKYIDAWFEGPLYLASFSQGYSPCQHWVEIKDEGRHAPQGPRYCNMVRDSGRFPIYDPPTHDNPITSTDNEMMIIFKAPDYRTSSVNASNYITLHVGFKLCYALSDRPRTTIDPDLGPNAEAHTDDSSEEDHVDLALIGIIVAILLVMLIMLILVLICCVYKRRKRMRTPSNVQQQVLPEAAVAYENPGYIDQSTVNVFATSTMELEVKKNPDELDFTQVGILPGGGSPTPAYGVAPPEYAEHPPPNPVVGQEEAPEYCYAGPEIVDKDTDPVYQNTSNDSKEN